MEFSCQWCFVFIRSHRFVVGFFFAFKGVKFNFFNAIFNPISVTSVYRGGQFYWWRKPEYTEKTNSFTMAEVTCDEIMKSPKIPKGGNQNPYIEEEQTTQWPKEKVQKDKQRSTKHTHKIKNRVTRTPLKTGCEPWCS